MCVQYAHRHRVAITEVCNINQHSYARQSLVGWEAAWNKSNTNLLLRTTQRLSYQHNATSKEPRVYCIREGVLHDTNVVAGI
jgi:hypothetical protein